MQVSQKLGPTHSPILFSPIAKAVAITAAVVGTVTAVASAIFCAANAGLISLGAATALIASFPPVLPIALCALGTAVALASLIFFIIKGHANKRISEHNRKVVEQFVLAKDELFKKGGDDKKAFDLFTKAAKDGHPLAKLYLANLYEYGKGCVENDEQSFKLSKEVADQGHSHGCYALGICYLYGVGCVENEKQGFELCKKAAEKGDPDIQLAFYKEFRYDFDLETKKLAFEFLRKAASKGYLPAQVKLGEFYQIDKRLWAKEELANITRIDPAIQAEKQADAEAIKWFTLAAASKTSGRKEFTGRLMSKYIKRATENLNELKNESKKEVK